MNTKGIKFLAVLAVLAMAFATVTFTQDAEESDATELSLKVYDSESTTAGTDGFYVNAAVATSTALTTGGEVFYIYPGDSGFKVNITPKASSAVTLKILSAAADVTGTTATIDNSKVLTTIIYVSATAETSVAQDFTIGADGTIETTDGGNLSESTYGICFSDGATYKYWPQGAEQNLTIDAAGEYVKVGKATATITQPASTTEGAKADAGVIKVVDETGASTGTITWGGGATTGPMTVDVGESHTSKLTMVSGSAKIATTAPTAANLNAFAVIANTAPAADDVLYGSGTYTTDVAAINAAYGNVTGTIEQTTPAAIGLTTVTSDKLELKIGTTSYSFTANKATATINGTAITAVSAGTLTLAKGSFTITDYTGEQVTGGTVEIAEAASASIGAPVSKTNLTILGALTNSTSPVTPLNVGSAVTLGQNASIDKTITFSGSMSDDVEGDYAIQGTLQSSISVSNASLSGNTIIPADYTLTVTENLFLGGHTLTVYGTLIVKSGAAITTTSVLSPISNAIILASTGTIQNNGVIGKNLGVIYISQENPESMITMTAVSGVSVESVKVGDSYSLSISGTAIAQESAANKASQIVADGIIIDSTTLSTGVSLYSKDAVLTSGSHMVINSGAALNVFAGPADATAGSFIMEYDSALTVNGFLRGSVVMETFVKKTKAEISDPTFEPGTTVITGGANDATDVVTGFSLGVDRVQYSKTTTTTGTTTVYYDQRAYISGTLDIASTNTTAGPATLTLTEGTLFVDEADLLVVKTASPATTFTLSGTLVVLGTVTGLNATSSVIGAAFYVVSGTDTTYYVTGFEAGIAALGDAKTVNLFGGDSDTYGNGVGTYTPAADIEIQDGQSLKNKNGVASLIIGTKVSVIVYSGGSFDGTLVSSLSGKVIVKNGGNVSSPSSMNYQVVSTATDGTKTYAGLSVVLSEAQPGDEVVFSGNNAGSYIASATVPAQVTLKVTGDLYIKSLTVAEEGIVKVTSTGSLTMAGTESTPAKLTVYGAVDTSAGTFKFNGAAGYESKSVISSEGTITISTADVANIGEGVTISAASYTSGNNTIYTTLAIAVENGATDIEVGAGYTTSDIIILPEGATLTVSGADVEIDSLTIAGATLNVTGSFTGTIYAVNGAGLDIEPAELAVSNFKGQLTNVSTINSEGLDEFEFKTASVVFGTIDLEEGQISIAHNVSGTDSIYKGTFDVAEDAEVIIADSMALGDNMTKVCIDGTLTVAKGKTLTMNKPLYIYGEADVKGTLAMGGSELFLYGEMYVTGTLTSAGFVDIVGYLEIDDEATANVTNVLVGTAPVAADPYIVGKLTMANNSYALAYGEDVSAESFTNVGLVTVQYVINDDTYATAVVYGSVNYSTILDKLYALGIELEGYNLDGIKDINKWTRANGSSLPPAVTDGVDAYFTAPLVQVTLKTSWATGSSLYIDNVRITDSTYTLSVGTHTVSSVVNPGYKGTTSISYDGTTLTTGKIIVSEGDDDVVLAVTGDITIDTGDDPAPSSSDNTLTTILLVVLVIMVVIMAAVTVLRMMRS